MPTPDINQFKVDPTNFLGGQYQSYRDAMYSQALSNPAAYQQKRQEVVSGVKDKLISDFYTTIYNLLNEGVAPGVTALAPAPSYPLQKIGDFALESAVVLSQILDKAIAIVLPADFKQLAESRLAAIGDARVSGSGVSTASVGTSTAGGL